MEKLFMVSGGTPDDMFRAACDRLAVSVAGGREVTGADRRVAESLAAIERDWPGWRCWRSSLSPLYYARKPGVVPPLVVRAASSEGLRAEVERAEAEESGRGQR